MLMSLLHFIQIMALIFKVRTTQLKECSIKTYIKIFNAIFDPKESHGTLIPLWPVHREGAWKRLIRSVRWLLSNLPLDPQNIAVKPDILRTMLAGAQKIINARHLTPIRTSPDDCDAITLSSLIHHH